MYHKAVLYLMVLQMIVGFNPADTSNEFSKSSLLNLSAEPVPKPEKLRNTQTLEELVKTNLNAFTIWNITHNYDLFDSNKTKEICIWEMQRNNALIPVYILNITFNSTETFMEDYMIKEFKGYSGNELKYARKLHKNRLKVIDDMEKYFAISKNVTRHKEKEDKNTEITCISNTFCGCIQTSYFKTFDLEIEDFKAQTKHLWEFIIFGSYIDPLFRIITVFIGLILNCVLLYIFYKEDIVRTESCILILNLAISNVLMIILYIPANYVGTYHMYDYGDDSYRVIFSIQILVISANTLTIFFLNIQRYFDVSRVLDRENKSCNLKPNTRSTTYLVTLWVWCIAMSLIFGTMNPYFAQSLKIVLYVLLYLFVFCIVLTVFSSLTARKLQQSAKQGNAVSDLKKIAGSGIVLSLTATFYITHLPFFIFSTYESLVEWMYMDFYNSSVTRIIMFIIHIIFLLYPVLNVIVIHKASGIFRYFLNEYLFRCWYNAQERQHLTMTSVQSSDTNAL